MGIGDGLLKISFVVGDPEPFEERLLELGAQSTTFEDAEDRPIYEPLPGSEPLWPKVRVSALFPLAFEADAIAQALQVVSVDLACPEPSDFHAEIISDQDWIQSTQSHFGPMRFGTHLWIVPSWEANATGPADDPDAVILRLDPGLAFGTGTHATTALCLEWLDAHPPKGARVIDWGCGSGVLAIASALLDAQHVLAVDVDPQALHATASNAQRNLVPATTLDIGAVDNRGSLQAPIARSANLVLANILAEPLLSLRDRFAELLVPGGRVVLSGILVEQAQAVIEWYSRRFTVDWQAERDGWACLSGVMLDVS